MLPHRSSALRTVAASGLMLLSLAATARVISVGPDGEFRRIADAARAAHDDDIVEIQPGSYRGDVAVWSQKRLQIRGSGARPSLVADGASAEDKAIWVFRNGDFEVRNIEFRGARVADRNGAGIRLESGRLAVIDCLFEDNEHGILTSNIDGTELSVSDSVFRNAPKDEKSLLHLIYVGRIASLRITGSRFESGFHAHLIKSRARRSELRHNLVDDRPDGFASYEIDFPNGGDVTLVGNIIAKGSHATNSTLIAYGAEGPRWPVNRLRLAHNTLIASGWSPARFLRTWDKGFVTPVQVEAYNNLTVGFGPFVIGQPGRHRGNARLLPGRLGAKGTQDFRPASDALPRGSAVPLPDEDMLPRRQFRFPVGSEPLPSRLPEVPGAFPLP